MKKVLILALCLFLSLVVFTACTEEEPPHEHTFADVWNYNDTEHWHDATCEHTSEQADKGAHVDNDGNDICDTCGRVNNHTHSFATEWSWDEEFHYYKSACGHNVKDAQAAHADENNDAICDVCTYDYDHEHAYAEEWSVTEGGHWHAPSCGHDVPGIDKMGHTDENNDGACDVCGDMGGHEHTYATEWSKTEDEHWHEVTCDHTIPVADKNAHVDEDNDKACDVCGYQPEHFHTFEEGWSSDANGHFHKATCGHDVKKDETAHNGFEEDGICDTCAYVVFRFFDVTVTLPEDSVTLTAPDGSSNPTVTVKQGTDVSFKLTMPGYIEIATINGATVEGEPVDEGSYHSYTIKVANVQAAVTVTLTLRKNSNVEVIIADGKQDMTIEKKFQQVKGTMTFSVPSSGRYIIYSSSHPGLNGVTFKLEGENPVEQNESSIAYAFDMQGAGDVTVTYNYFPWTKPESGVETFTYVVAKVELTKTLEELEGEDYLMPTNAVVDVTFTVPAPGLYQISSSSPVSWNGDTNTPHIFDVAAGNLTVTMAVHYDLPSQPTFPFDWKIEPVGGSYPVMLGDNAMTAPVDDYYGITFTPDKNGTYHFAFPDDSILLFHWYTSNYGNSMNPLGSSWTSEPLKAGETITLYVRTNIYNEDIIEAIDTVLTISYIPELTEDGYLAQTGSANIFSNTDVTSEFMLTAPAGAQVSVDGGATWHQSVLVEIKIGMLLSYLVKSENGATEVAVMIERMEYAYTLGVGENTVTLIPGKEYDITLSGTISPNHYVDYILAWSDANLAVSYGGNILSSPAEILSYSPYSSSITVIYNGTSESSVTFELIDTYVAPDYMRDQLDGDYVVNGDNGVLYEVTFTPVSDDGELLTGTMAIVDNKNGTLTGTYNFAYTKAEGATVTDLEGNSVSILLGMDSLNQITFQCEGMPLPAVLEDPADQPPVELGDLVPGPNTLKVSDGVNGDLFIFIAPVTGEYTFEYALGETNGYPVVIDGFVTTLISFPYTVTMTAGEKLNLLMGTYNMESDTIDIIINAPASVMPEPFDPVDPSDTFYAKLSGTYKVNYLVDRLYVVTFTPDSLNNPNGTLVIEDQNTYKFNGTYKFVYKPGQGVTVTDMNGAAVEIYITQNAGGDLLFQTSALKVPQVLIAVSDAGGSGDTPIITELSVGENAVVVSDSYRGTMLSFTASEAGTYKLTWAADETNGEIMMGDDYMSEIISIPYEFTLATGESISFMFFTLDYASDTVDVVIEKL